MPIGFDTFHNAGRQKVFRRSAIEDPLIRMGEIRKTRACAHVKTHGGLLCIDVKVVFSHREGFCHAFTLKQFDRLSDLFDCLVHSRWNFNLGTFKVG
jgi:hypothetical protein